MSIGGVIRPRTQFQLVGDDSIVARPGFRVRVNLLTRGVEIAALTMWLHSHSPVSHRSNRSSSWPG
jgi:hypothetical protein